MKETVSKNAGTVEICVRKTRVLFTCETHSFFPLLNDSCALKDPVFSLFLCFIFVLTLPSSLHNNCVAGMLSETNQSEEMH